ncbi:MAG TPA: pyridoxamine 5'-phosphate oxidase family protein [Methanocorpusculum sp.]|nr:pyridoxamine 5'-phosphate oxidase family protein [Methanocorpusculum sp.]HJJ89936.1 pyridoxamine 5'-phosphate oxidase family protein [Methanocorpusculum sp.]HJJ90443.1 pyridoxamine 5'-phosphate oxidase family protein [Methanocorpusculum sp.]
MALINDEIKRQIEKVGVCHLITASKSGVPNAAPMGGLWVMDNDTIWIANNFMNKTAINVRENPQAALLVWSPEISNCIQLKGTATLESDTAEHAMMMEMMDAKKPGLPKKELLKLVIRDIYTCMPGPAAGSKIA